MTTLINLSHIESNQKWILNHASINRVEKTRGSLKNILDFNRVVNFTRQEIHKCSSTESALYVFNLKKKYKHIKESIEKQNLITRLFLKIILFFCRFNRNFDAFLLTYLSCNPRQANFSSMGQTHPTLPPIQKGGFSNGGNTCFIAAPLHCLNVMKELLPKHVDQMKKSKNETYIQFAKRQFAAEKILKLLEASNQGRTSSGQSLQDLRKNLCEYNSSIPVGTMPGDSHYVMEYFLEILKTPHLKVIYTQENGEKIQSKQRTFGFTIEDGASKEMGVLIDFEAKVDGSYQPINQEVSTLKGLPPLFIPVLVTRNDRSDQIPVPKILSFSNLKNKNYSLIACQSGSLNHAYSFVKSEDKWIKYDDSSVSSVREEEAFNEISKKCGILIYRLIEQ